MNKKYWLIPLALFLYSILPNMAYGGGHENCRMCHLSTAKGKYTLIVKPDFSAINPNTGQAFNKEDALCMSCHRIKAKSIHPVGIVPNPQKVTLPPEATSKEGKITCMSCHDFHGEKQNYKYLRWPADGGKNISKFCVAQCHAQYAAVPTSTRLPSHLVKR